ncbi:unnamed protein product, partial [Amoebophrya sp. A25]|eukprot:GSA25T00012025001.1
MAQVGGSSSSSSSLRPSLSRCETVDLSRLQQLQRVAFFDLLDEFSGRKILALDEALLGPLDLILDVSDLTEHGAEVRKIGEPIVSDVSQMLFLVRALNFDLAEKIALQIQQDERNRRSAHQVERTYVLAFAPRISHTGLQILREKNVYGSLHFIREMPQLALFAVDDDLLSMEMPEVFPDYYVAQDPSALYEVALALHSWEQTFASAQNFRPKIFSVGRASKYVTDVICSGRLDGVGGRSHYSSAAAAHAGGGAEGGAPVAGG